MKTDKDRQKQTATSKLKRPIPLNIELYNRNVAGLKDSYTLGRTLTDGSIVLHPR